MRKFLRDVVFQNPVRAETKRAFRKFFSMGLQGRSRAAGPWAIAILYMFVLIGFTSLCYSGYDGRGVVPPDVPLHFLVFLSLVIPILTSYNAISGERERRSWDILRVSPITPAQIVVGKFLSGATVIVIGWLVFLPAILVSAASFRRDADTFYTAGGGYRSGYENTILQPYPMADVISASLVPVCCAFVVLALTLFFSARCRTSLAAMGVALLFVFAGAVVYPSLVQLATGGSEWARVFTFSPFILVDSLIHPDRSELRSNVADLLTTAAETLFFVSAFLTWTTKTLVFAEQDVKFINKKKTHA